MKDTLKSILLILISPLLYGAWLYTNQSGYYNLFAVWVVINALVSVTIVMGVLYGYSKLTGFMKEHGITNLKKELRDIVASSEAKEVYELRKSMIEASAKMKSQAFLILVGRIIGFVITVHLLWVGSWFVGALGILNMAIGYGLVKLVQHVINKMGEAINDVPVLTDEVVL